MPVLSASRLAAFAVATLLPLAGPAQADPHVLPLAAKSAASAPSLASDAPVSLLPTSSAHVVPLAAAAATIQQTPDVTTFETKVFEPMGSGVASFYGRHLKGARTASGQRYAPDAMTAAHRTLPFGTQVQVTNPANGESVVVTINDRGPFHGNRVIDLSDAAAEELGLVRMGSGRVDLAVLAD